MVNTSPRTAGHGGSGPTSVVARSGSEVPATDRPDAISAANLSELDGFTRVEQVKLLYQNGVVAIVATAVLAALIVLALWPVAGHRLLLGWLLAYLAITGIRLRFIRQYRQDPRQSERSRHWLRIYDTWTGISGAAWGTAAVLFFVPEQPEYVLLMTCLYAVVVAVAAQALAPSIVAFLVFAISMISPLMVMLILAGGTFYYPLGMLGILYLVANIGFAFNVHRTVMASITLRFENLELIELLQKEKEAAQEANIAKSRFLAAASHDLRQPLHALGLFQDALEPHIKATGRPVVERMRQSIAALSGLFDSLLDISRLDAGVVEASPKHVALRSLIDPLLQEFRSDVVEKGLELTHSCEDVVVYVDPVILERIIRNLLSNAVHYTDEGSINLRCVPEGKTRTRIDIMDTGRGIPPEQQDRVFSAFYQLHNPERDRTKGLGLGLSIVKRLCALSEFEFVLDSEPGAGSTFSVVVPLGNRGQVTAPAAPRAWELRGRLVVAIDDERDILESMGRVLERWGCETVLAESADEAIAALNSRDDTPSIIVADYRLRDNQTGLTAITAIRDALGREIPALLISGDTAPERLREVAASGLRLLHKPVLPVELRAALHQEIIDRVD